MTTLDQVKEFHLAFGHPVHDRAHIDDEQTNRLRVRLLQEELDELKWALGVPATFWQRVLSWLIRFPKKRTEALDALCDLQYVLDGAFLALGFHRVKDAAFREVHASNMSKLGPDGEPVKRADGKIMKGPNYFAPNLEEYADGLPFVPDQYTVPRRD